MRTKYSKTSENVFLLIISIFFIILSLYLIKELIFSIIFAFILAYFLFPLYNTYLKKIKSERISSILSIFTATFVLIIPLVLVSYFLILNLFKLILEYKNYFENPKLLNSAVEKILEKITNSALLSGVNYSDFFNHITSFALDFSKKFFSSIPSSLFNFFIIMFITYYLLIYNEKILKSINESLPLSFKKQNEILKNITKNLRVLFKGYFLTGFVQTIVAMIGYFIFGVNNILVVTVITFFASLIPYIGTPLIWVPISIYMIVIGEPNSGIGLLIYGTLIVSTVDNFLRPIFMSEKGSLSPALVFVGFIGGMMVFGISGIILGPIILSITLILMRYLKEDFEVKN